MRRKVPRLPDAYQEVDYIQSSCSWTTEGTNWQRIATWFSPKNTSKIELKISDFTQNWSFALFWEDQSRWTRWFTVISRSYEFWVNAVFDDWTATTRTICDWWTHIIELSQSWLIVDWTTIATPASASFTWVELNLFAMNRNGTAREFGWFKMYYCKLWDGETLVRDFVPCYRKSDSVIWMYDLVNNQFYTNSWSGAFTKGTDSSTLELKEFQVWPDDQWELFDETIIANSTTWSSWVIASVNGTFIRPSYTFGGWNGAYTKTTREWYDVISASWSHWNCHIWMSQSTYDTLIGNYSKIKIVVDYFNIWSQPSSYTNGVYFGNRDYINATSSGIWIGADWAGANLALSTWYSLEEIINTSDLSTTATITKISDGTKQVLWPFTKSFFKETSSTYIINGWWPCWARVVRDNYWWPADVGNIHIYVC